MKNLFLSLIFLFAMSSFAFAANEVGKVSTFDVEETLAITNPIESINVNSINLSLELTELSKNIETVGWACCSVSTSDSEVTVCRSDGNLGRACRQARRLL